MMPTLRFRCRTSWIVLSILCIAATASAQRNLKDIPDPDPELERKSFIVADGFEVNLFAGDPKLAKPIQMSFDAEGRLWVASSETYPQIKPGQPASDKILVLEDTDHDGSIDKTTVFADGLLIPTGILPGDGGVYVANSTEIIHLSDTDGDGKADRRKVILSGFGTEDTHHIVHAFRWGMDGMMYFNQSIYIHSHIETPYGVRRLGGGGIWQYRPETMQLEILCRGFVNPWGHSFDRWGQSFATDGAYGEGINFVFPGSVFVTAPGAKRRLKGLNPGSPKHCGLEILSGRHLPDDWQGNMLTNDFRAHRVCRFVVSEDGSGYSSRQETELIKTSHGSFRPIDVAMGPDGAIYIADWYNPIIQHGEVDFRDERRDHVHGRIWRVTAKGRPLVPHAQVVGASVDQLLDLLRSPEDLTRRHAKIQLKALGAEKVLTRLTAWTNAIKGNDPEAIHQRLEALWTHQAINHVNESLLTSLAKSSDHRARAAALRVAVAWRDRVPQWETMVRGGVVDDHPRVRLEALRGLANAKSATAAATALKALERPMDRFLDFALWQTLRDLSPEWVPALQAGKFDVGGNVDQLTFALKAVDSPGVVQPLVALLKGDLSRERQMGVIKLLASLGGPNELALLLSRATGDSAHTPQRRAEILQALVLAANQRRVQPAGDKSAVIPLLKSEVLGLQVSSLQAIGAWRLVAARSEIEKLASDAGQADVIRKTAITTLAGLGGKESVEALDRIAKSAAAVGDRHAAIAEMSRIDVVRAASLAVAQLKQTKAGVSPAPFISPLMQRQQGPTALASALKSVTISSDVAKLALRTVEGAPRRVPAVENAIRVAGKLSEAKTWTPGELAVLLADVATKGDPNRGESVFRRQELSCLKCHSIAGAGGRVGPDMVSIGASAPVDYLLDSLIFPNKKVKENFHSVSVVTDEGKIISGIPVRTSKTELVLRDSEDRTVTVLVNSIEEKQEGKSLMPAGLVDSLTRQELVDLVRFLSELGKVGPFAVDNQPRVRRWKQLLWTQDGHRRLNRTSFDTAASDDPALSWGSAYSQVNGALPLATLAKFVPHRGLDPMGFVRFEYEVTTPGEISFDFGDVKGMSMWVDGRPAKLAPQVVLEATQGRHHITLGVNLKIREKPLQCSLLVVPESTAKLQLTVGK